MTLSADQIRKIQTMRRGVPALADDDAWRDFLTLHGGARSAKAIDANRFVVIVDALKAAGATESTKNPRAKAGGYKSRFAGQAPYKKARALWIELGKAGALDDRSDAALDAYVARMAGQELGKLSARQWDGVIGGLRGWLDRA